MRKFVVLFTLIFTFFSTSYLQTQEEQSNKSGEKKTLSMDDVVASIEDDKIYLKEIVETMQSIKFKDYYNEVLDYCIKKLLIKKYIASNGITCTNDELKKRVELEIRTLEDDCKRQYKISLTEFLEKTAKIDVEEYKKILLDDENFQWQYMLEKAVEYDLLNEEKVEVQHILVDKNEEAEKILDELKKGADFGKLAEKKSRTSLLEKDGRLEPFILGMSKYKWDFDKAAFSLKTNEVSGVVRGQYGYHVIRVINKIPSLNKSFKELEGEIISKLNEKKMSTEIIGMWVERLQKLNSHIIKYQNQKIDLNK